MRALTILMLFSMIHVSSAQETWTRMTDIPAAMLARKGAVSFSINGLGYVGTGSTSAGIYLKDFWEYNPNTDSWFQRQDVPGVPRYLAVGFSIGNKGYVGTGNIANNQSLVGSNDFYEFDPTTGQWAIRQSVGFTGRISSVGFGIGGKGYITTGFNGNNFASYDNTTWEFDPTLNSGYGGWIQRADFPGGSRHGAASFVVNGKAYVTAGEKANPNQLPQVINYKDTWEFNPATGNWIQKALLPTAFLSSSGFAINNKGYLLGNPFSGGYSRLWSYNPSSNTWSQGPTYSQLPSNPTIFQICNKGYVSGNNFSRQVWKLTQQTPVLAVSGPDVMCTPGQLSFTAYNVPIGGVVTWQVSSPSWVSPSTGSGNNFTTDLLPGFGPGTLVVYATVSGQCGTSAWKTVDVGFPEALCTPEVIVVEPCSTLQATTCTGGLSIYNWYIDGNLVASSPNNDVSISLIGNPLLAGAHSLCVTTVNGCGESPMECSTFVTGDCSWQFGMAYPNPAQNVISLIMKAGDKETLEMEYTYQLIDKNGTSVKGGMSNRNSLLIDVQDIPRGTYIFEVCIAGKSTQQRILIN